MDKSTEFWENGEDRPVEDFLNSLPHKTKKIILSKVDLLDKYGLGDSLRLGLTKVIRKGLYELKVSAYRILFVIKENVTWFLHGFVKKSNKTPDREIRIAIKRAAMLGVIIQF